LEYKLLIDSGVFRNQLELAARLGKIRAWVSKNLKVSRPKMIELIYNKILGQNY